jgi:hypothetical protein
VGLLEYVVVPAIVVLEASTAGIGTREVLAMCVVGEVEIAESGSDVDGGGMDVIVWIEGEDCGGDVDAGRLFLRIMTL